MMKVTYAGNGKKIIDIAITEIEFLNGFLKFKTSEFERVFSVKYLISIEEVKEDDIESQEE